MGWALVDGVVTGVSARDVADPPQVTLDLSVQLIWSGRLSSGQGEAPPGWMSGGASFGWPGLLWVGASRVYATALSG